MLALDHLVFTTADLTTGTKWMSQALGLPPTGAGRHAAMGTYNRLWRVGHTYLELIAIDPEAPAPPHARWFGLDSVPPEAPPALATWVARARDLDAALVAAPRDPGTMHALSRDGLHWRLTVPADGLPLWSGAYPALIEWEEGSLPPSASLPDQGLQLSAFRVDGPAELFAELTALGATSAISLGREAPRPVLHLTLTSPETGRVHFSTA
ncbi:MAG: VOC family protein [Pseudomonadota bacterium]